VLAWQGDRESIPLLRRMQQQSPEDAALLGWAIEKIESLDLR